MKNAGTPDFEVVNEYLAKNGFLMEPEQYLEIGNGTNVELSLIVKKGSQCFKGPLFQQAIGIEALGNTLEQGIFGFEGRELVSLLYQLQPDLLRQFDHELSTVMKQYDGNMSLVTQTICNSPQKPENLDIYYAVKPYLLKFLNEQNPIYPPQTLQKRDGNLTQLVAVSSPLTQGFHERGEELNQFLGSLLTSKKPGDGSGRVEPHPTLQVLDGIRDPNINYRWYGVSQDMYAHDSSLGPR